MNHREIMIRAGENIPREGSTGPLSPCYIAGIARVMAVPYDTVYSWYSRGKVPKRHRCELAKLAGVDEGEFESGR